KYMQSRVSGRQDRSVAGQSRLLLANCKRKRVAEEILVSTWRKPDGDRSSLVTVLESPQVVLASYHNDAIGDSRGGVAVLCQVIYRQDVPVTTGLEHRELAGFINKKELPIGCHRRGKEVAFDPGYP